MKERVYDLCDITDRSNKSLRNNDYAVTVICKLQSYCIKRKLLYSYSITCQATVYLGNSVTKVQNSGLNLVFM